MTYVTLREPISTTVEEKRKLYKKVTMQAFVRGLKEPLGSRIRCMRPKGVYTLHRGGRVFRRRGAAVAAVFHRRTSDTNAGEYGLVTRDPSYRMDSTLVIGTLLCVLRNRRKKRKTRTIWIHPFISSRKSNGKFYCDYDSLRKNPKKFRNCFRMSIDTFDLILGRVHNGLQKNCTKMRECISPPEMLMVTIT